MDGSDIRNSRSKAKDQKQLFQADAKALDNRQLIIGEKIGFTVGLDVEVTGSNFRTLCLFPQVTGSWWKDIEESESVRKGSEHNGNCLNTNDIYTPQDKTKYGDFVPAVCGPGDIHMSRAETLNGSTSNTFLLSSLQP